MQQGPIHGVSEICGIGPALSSLLDHVRIMTFVSEQVEVLQLSGSDFPST